MLIISGKKSQLLTPPWSQKEGNGEIKGEYGHWEKKMGKSKKYNVPVREAFLVCCVRALSEPCLDSLTRLFNFWTPSNASSESPGYQLARTDLGGGPPPTDPSIRVGLPCRSTSEGWEGGGQTKPSKPPFRLKSVISFISTTYSDIHSSPWLFAK